MEGETILAIAIAVTGAIGSALVKFFDWKKNQAAQLAAEHQAQRVHELELAKMKAEAAQKLSDTALRASIVGIERHKRTMTPEGQVALAKAIQDAAIEESAEDHLNQHVDKITKKTGTQFYSPEELKKKLDN